MGELNRVAIYSSDILGIGVLVISSVCAKALMRHNSRRDVRVLRVIFFLNLCACFFDMLATFVNGRPGSAFRWINILTNTYLYFINASVVVLWVSFMRYHLFGTSKETEKYLMIYRAFNLLLIVVATVNIFVPFIFSIDENNNYARLRGTYVYIGFTMICLVISILDYIRYRIRMKKGMIRFFPIAAFLGPVIVGVTLQAFFYGTSFIWPCLAIAVSGGIISLQNEYTYIDNLTGMLNRSFLFDYRVYMKCHGIMMLDINGFKQINDTYGHAEGDAALVVVGRLLRSAVADYGIAIRYAGDEFLCFSYDGDLTKMQQALIEGREKVRKYNVTGKKPYELQLAYGMMVYDPKKDDIDEVIRQVDAKMYDCKQKFYEDHPDFKKTLRV